MTAYKYFFIAKSNSPIKIRVFAKTRVQNHINQLRYSHSKSGKKIEFFNKRKLVLGLAHVMQVSEPKKVSKQLDLNFQYC